MFLWRCFLLSIQSEFRIWALLSVIKNKQTNKNKQYQTCLASGETTGEHCERPYTKTSRTMYGGGSKMSSTSGNVMFSFLITSKKKLS